MKYDTFMFLLETVHLWLEERINIRQLSILDSYALIS